MYNGGNLRENVQINKVLLFQKNNSAYRKEQEMLNLKEVRLIL